MAVVCDLLSSESLLDIVLNKANISELIETAFGCRRWWHSGAALADTLAGPAHFAV